jgi:hypothetical protein
MKELEEGVWETDADQFEVFRQEASYWLREYGLLGWEIHFIHEERENARASCTTYGAGRICLFTLATTWTAIEPTYESIAESAFHEVWELLLADLVEATQARKYDAEEVEAKTHAIIRTMENVHWKGEERVAKFVKQLKKKKK